MSHISHSVTAGKYKLYSRETISTQPQVSTSYITECKYILRTGPLWKFPCNLKVFWENRSIVNFKCGAVCFWKMICLSPKQYVTLPGDPTSLTSKYKLDAIWLVRFYQVHNYGYTFALIAVTILVSRKNRINSTSGAAMKFAAVPTSSSITWNSACSWDALLTLQQVRWISPRYKLQELF